MRKEMVVSINMEIFDGNLAFPTNECDCKYGGMFSTLTQKELVL